MSVESLHVRPLTEVGLPDDHHFGRNLVDGVWGFPAAPYEYEIRNPLDSTITTVVPLSSRFDVARAVVAARRAAPAWAAEEDLRVTLVHRLVDALERLSPDLGALQSTETGLAPVDSQRASAASAVLARRLVRRAAGRPRPAVPGVAGLVLSWGLPLVDAVAAVVPQLAAGRTVVVKPSLRAPMSAVALAHIATGLGFPPGVVNVVQGTAEDVGLALSGTADLALVHVRGGPRAVAQATRAAAVSGVPFAPLHGGGNVAVAGPAADPAALAAVLAEATRTHSTGGPSGLPLVAAHADVADDLVEAVLAATTNLVPAPLPTETVRRRATAAVEALRAAGATVHSGGRIPDDIPHRMGWLLPPTVLTGMPLSGAGDRAELLGPVLDIRIWTSPEELAGAFPAFRYTCGTASVWGLGEREAAAAALPQQLVLRSEGPAAALRAGRLPTAWLSPTGTDGGERS